MRTLAPAPLLLVLVTTTIACEGGDATPLPPTVGNALRLTAGSPYPSSCSTGAGTIYRGSEVEPSLAVDPSDPQHLVAIWQQDRAGNGGARGIRTAVSHDGGASWTLGGPALTHCSGGTASGNGNYERTTDPWITVAADGIVHLAAYSFDRSDVRQAVVSARSVDGGLTWSAPVVVSAATTADLALDKESITADPTSAGTLYLTWDRLTAQDQTDPTQMTGPAWFARSIDGGVTWSTPTIVHDPGLDAQTIGAIVAVLPDGTLIELVTELADLAAISPQGTLIVRRSANGGDTWSDRIVVAGLQSVGVADPKTRAAVRTGDILPSIAVDPVAGTVWIAWEDARFSGSARDGIAVSHSEDGGVSWSTPVQVNQNTDVQAFTPVVAVSASGEVAVSYYDLRYDSSSDPGHLWAAGFVVRSSDGGVTWQESAQGERFDLRRAPDAGGWFVGDYTGLVARGSTFTALMVFTNDSSGNPTDCFISDVQATTAATKATVQRNEQPKSLLERSRQTREH